MNRRRPLALGVLALVTPLALAACGSDDIGISGAWGAPDSTRLEVGLDEGCNADIDVTIDESATEIAVSVTYASDPGDDGEDCGESRTIELEAPLGDRTLIDASSGDPVPVQQPEEYTEAP